MITSPADTLVYDAARIASWQAESAYAYNRELVTPELNVLQWVMKKVDEVLQAIFGTAFVERYSTLFLVCISILIFLLVLWFLYRRRPELFMRSGKKKLAYTVAEDTIYGVDFEAGIAKALERNDYREAVRLLYLQTLKRLSDEGRINWQLYKTPTQYLYEVRAAAFRQMTHHFLRVRYGNFEANSSLFEEMKLLKGSLEKGGKG